jgi:uncharacterized protein with PhoU and TrkA domain
MSEQEILKLEKKIDELERKVDALDSLNGTLIDDAGELRARNKELEEALESIYNISKVLV